jgi:hypothetical protein
VLRRIPGPTQAATQWIQPVFIPDDSMELTSRLSVFSKGDLTDPAQKQLLSNAEDYCSVNLRNSKPTECTIYRQTSQTVYNQAAIHIVSAGLFSKSFHL